MTNGQTGYHHGDLRAALLVEAASMIDEGGVESVTMRGIGQRLGVSRAAAYRHFDDKADLLVAVAATGFARLGSRLREANADAEEDGVDELRRLGEEYVAFALENPAHYRLMYGREALTREGQPELKHPADALFEEFVSVIERHQESGALRKDDPRAQAYVAWGAVHGVASLVIEGQIRADVDARALARSTTNTLLNGLRASA